MRLTRNVLKQPIVIGGVVLAVAALMTSATCVASASQTSVVSAASAAPAAFAAHPHRCTPSQPSFTSLLATSTVSCRQARALNTYMTRHETLAGRFVLNGETWLGTVSSRAPNETDMVYRNGAQTVWITYGGPAS